MRAVKDIRASETLVGHRKEWGASQRWARARHFPELCAHLAGQMCSEFGQPRRASVVVRREEAVPGKPLPSPPPTELPPATA